MTSTSVHSDMARTQIWHALRYGMHSDIACTHSTVCSELQGNTLLSLTRCIVHASIHCAGLSQVAVHFKCLIWIFITPQVRMCCCCIQIWHRTVGSIIPTPFSGSSAADYRHNVNNHRTKCTFDVAFDSTCFAQCNAAQQKQGRNRAILLLTTVCLQGTQVGIAIEFWGNCLTSASRTKYTNTFSHPLYNTDSVAMHVTLVQSIASQCTAFCQMFTSVLMLAVNQIAVQDLLWSLNPPKHPASQPGLGRLLSV